MRQFYSDEEIAEIMSPIEDPLQMQKIIEVKRGPISRFLTSVVSGFGVLSYVRIFKINWKIQGLNFMLFFQILVIGAILGAIYGAFYVYKKAMEKRKRLNADLTFDSEDE